MRAAADPTICGIIFSLFEFSNIATASFAPAESSWSIGSVFRDRPPRSDSQLDLVSRAQRQGGAVGSYLSNYDLREDWRLAPAWLEGREVIAVFRPSGDARPGYFIELGIEDGKVRFIRDFRYVPYIMRDAQIDERHSIIRRQTANSGHPLP